MPADYFGTADVPALVAWAEHSALAAGLRQRLLHERMDEDAYARLSAVCIAHDRAALALARGLRLTLNARADRDKAATLARQGARGPATLEMLRMRYRADAAAAAADDDQEPI